MRMIFVVAGTAVVMTVIAALLVCFVMEPPPVVSAPLEKADALVLMAGSDRNRMPAVVELYRRGHAPKILLTNDGELGAWSDFYKRNLSQVEWTRLKLVRMGIPHEAVIILEFTRSGTFYDALNTWRYVRGTDIETLLVVTSDYHTGRTLWSFRKVFDDSSVKLGIVPARPYSGPINAWEWIGRGKTLLIERMKLLYYKFRFGFLNGFQR